MLWSSECATTSIVAVLFLQRLADHRFITSHASDPSGQAIVVDPTVALPSALRVIENVLDGREHVTIYNWRRGILHFDPVRFGSSCHESLAAASARSPNRSDLRATVEGSTSVGFVPKHAVERDRIPLLARQCRNPVLVELVRDSDYRRSCQEIRE